MRPPKFVLVEPTIINERLTEVVHLISANGKILKKEEIEAVEILLNICKHLEELERVCDDRATRHESK